MTTRDSAVPTERAVALTGQGFSPDIVGGKGAALDRLIGSSIPVPTSGVVTQKYSTNVSNGLNTNAASAW